MDRNESEKELRSGKGLALYKVIIVGTIIVLCVMIAYLFIKDTSSQDYIYEAGEKQTKELVSLASNHMVVPDETPEVYLIQEPKLLIAEQSFFVGTEKGDYLLIFPKAGKAIIYSRDRDMIINAGPINFDNQFPPTPPPSDIDSANNDIQIATTTSGVE
ncbi:MAG: hypothetical protein H6779_03965 [Candidatus Nomurabacteria bacterium]|nr:MAG: hypothetical protein H6779_03965 [Candidatus Nomurabacteria bacterium]